LGDTANQLYMVGSMGCAVSLALGLAIARPERRVIAIDGDGAALMRLGALTTVAAERPPNLVHVLIDNGRHESTGGQATVSPGVDFCAIASGAGYRSVAVEAEPARVQAALVDRTPGLRFIHVPVLPGVLSGLPRPSMRPEAVAERFRAALGPREAPR
ncbi:MAG: thiamine pyrophosphate-dependent enzyme, partial [Gammaproteobacteria bacterium]|nr:thiamine pyrophosphate-dependent enzyme [Gammaproteobacteria bacterium]